MKRLIVVLVGLAILLSIASVSSVSVMAAEDDGFVWVYREFTITEDNFNEDVENSRLNPRAIFLTGEGKQLAYALQVKEMQLVVDGKVYGKYTVENGLNVGDCPVYTKDTVISIAAGAKTTTPAVWVFNDDTTTLPKGEYECIFKICLKVDGDGDFDNAGNAVDFNIWGEGLAGDISPSASEAVCFEELQEGTDAYFGDSGNQPTEEPTDTPEIPVTGTEKPQQTVEPNVTPTIEQTIEPTVNPTVTPAESGTSSQNDGFPGWIIAVIVVVVAAVAVAVIVVVQKKKK